MHTGRPYDNCLEKFDLLVERNRSGFIVVFSNKNNDLQGLSFRILYL